MADFIDIERVEIGPENLTAWVRIADGRPTMTSEDIKATERVYRVLPHIADHVCLGDAGTTFRKALPHTEIAHLLEHVTVELLAQTNLAGDTPAGRTWISDDDSRTYVIELACPDDVLVAAALSSGAWILDWAFAGGSKPAPNIEGIVEALVDLVSGLDDAGEDLVLDEDYDVAADEDEGAVEEEAEAEVAESEVAPEPQPEAEAEPAAEPKTAEAPAEAQPKPKTETPLWTPAPNVGHYYPESETSLPAAPEVEAEIDEIMATISMEPLVVDS